MPLLKHLIYFSIFNILVFTESWEGLVFSHNWGRPAAQGHRGHNFQTDPFQKWLSPLLMSLLQKAWSGLRVEIAFQEFDETLQGKGQYSETALEVNNFYYYPAGGGFTYVSVLYCFCTTPNFYTSVKFHPRKKNHSTTLNIQWQHYISHLLKQCYKPLKFDRKMLSINLLTLIILFSNCYQSSPPSSSLLFFLWLNPTDSWLGVPTEILTALSCVASSPLSSGLPWWPQQHSPQ